MPPVKSLFVLRHAKSSWDDPGLDDHERPLNPRGRRALEVMSEHVRANGIRPDLVLCSSSRRTRETLEGIAPTGQHLIERELYSAGADDLLERLRRLPEDIGAVMVIGHNPTVQMLVLRLSESGEGPERAAVQRKFPTGALATLAIDCKWSELAPHCSRLTEFLTPKELSRFAPAVQAVPAPPA
jgi:phosphohistidine phosphatase